MEAKGSHHVRCSDERISTVQVSNLHLQFAKRKRRSKDLSITDSIPFPSGFPESPTQKRTETKESFESCRELILENIDYDVLANDPHVDREQLDEIIDLVQETVCSTRSRIRVAGNDYPTEVVRSKLLRVCPKFCVNTAERCKIELK